MRVSSSVAGRSKAGNVARSFGPSSVGSGMLQCTRSGCDGNSGHTSRTRSHSVITTSKRCATNSSTMLGAVPADVDPALPHHPHRVGMQRLRMAPGRRGCDGALRHRLEQRFGDLRSRAVPGAQEQDPRRPDAGHPGRGVVGGDVAAEPQPGMQRTAGGLELLPAPGEIDRVVAVASDRPSCDARARDRPRAADPGGTTPSSAARRASSVNSRTARSLRTSSCSSRHRRGCASSRTNPGGPPDVRCDRTVGCTGRAYPPDPIASSQIDVYLQLGRAVLELRVIDERTTSEQRDEGLDGCRRVAVAVAG